jgi:hypothetical protein
MVSGRAPTRRPIPTDAEAHVHSQDAPRPARRRIPLRAALGALAVALLGLALPAAATPAAATTNATPTAARPAPARPAPPQIAALDFLLGSYHCAELPAPGITPADLRLETRKALGGHAYDLTARILPDQLLGRATLIWDPVNGQFVSHYVDDWGSYGVSTSPGFQDGSLTLTGSIEQVLAPSATGQAPGITLGLRDVYTVLGRGHFSEVQTVTVPDGRTVTHSYDCTRR